MISWKEFLNFLEGQTVNLAAPKTHYARGILITDDVPMFATSKAPIMFAGKVVNVEGENAMMEARWWKFNCLCRFHCLNRKMSRPAKHSQNI